MKEAPEVTARYLFESGLTVEEYEELQKHRRVRLDLWLDRRIEVIAKGEMELIERGDKILNELKKLHRKP